jgi:hypothetical protein
MRLMVVKSFHGHTLLSMSSDKIQDTRPITRSLNVFTNPESTKTDCFLCVQDEFLLVRK